MTPSGPRVVRAPRGESLSARSWLTEAPLRMLMNNLDPEVAERPDDLVVYGGTGKAARSWDAYDAIVRTLTTLGDDETLLVQSGKPVGVLQTHEWAPRVLLANSNLVGDDGERLHRRVRERYLDRVATNLDEAIALVTAARREKRALSVGVVGNSAAVLPELLQRGVEVDVVTDQTSAHDPLSYLPIG